MLTRPQTQRYSAEAGLGNIMIAEKEVVLTYLLQLLEDRDILERLAFKGGTCLRKMFVGSAGRFSTDLDFTRIKEHDHQDVVLAMMEAFESPFHDVQFSIPDDGYYETRDGMSWGVNPSYAHEWNPSGESEIRIQISRREIPTLPPTSISQCQQSYFRHLPFEPADITCMALPEILAEKLRACYQRSKARDIYDLATFATRPIDRPLVRRLVVLKLWQAGDAFEPEVLLAKFEGANAFDWEDLRQLVRRTQAIDPVDITAACLSGFAFLKDLSSEERVLAADRFRRERGLWKRLSEEIVVDKAQGPPT
ncbi:MAG: nucleotidyl transferase AbiEii/AbiGii toxin family protein [Gammaproteobacteria bacterium]|nr:nucleotidyl transferase AbiEii/AbiGii toxin family protein [Gammaproteobacteria bacterium]